MKHTAGTRCKRHARLVATSLVAGALLVSCGPTGTPPAADAATVAPQTFVDTFVDLRLAVLLDDPGRMDDSIRSAILARHGVTQQQLESFVTVHGVDVPYMRSVWDQVERRLQDTRPNVQDSATRGAGARSVPQAGRQDKPDRQGVPSTH